MFVLEDMKIWWKLYNNTGRRVDPGRGKKECEAVTATL